MITKGTAHSVRSEREMHFLWKMPGEASWVGRPCDFQGGSAHLTISGDELGGLNLLPRLITTLYYSCPLISFLFASCILDPETGRPRRDLVQWIVIKATPRDENWAKDKQAIFIWFCLENRYFCLPGQGSCCPYTLFFFLFLEISSESQETEEPCTKGE